eukprot:scaffold7451_cov185-Amphora_coffeaeformis.AAC.6
MTTVVLSTMTIQIFPVLEHSTAHILSFSTAPLSTVGATRISIVPARSVGPSRTVGYHTLVVFVVGQPNDNKRPCIPPLPFDL